MSALREVFATFTAEFATNELERGDSIVMDLVETLGIAEMGVGRFAASAAAAGPAIAASVGIMAGLFGGFALGAARVNQFATEMANLGNELNLNAIRLGVTTDEMQLMGRMAGSAGQPVERLVDAVGTMNERMRQAIGNRSGEQAALLRELGLEIPRSVEEIPDAMTLLEGAADGFAGMSNQGQRVAVAMGLFTDKGRDLLPILQQGSGGIAAAREEMERLGGGALPEMIERSAELNSAQSALDFAFLGLKSRLATSVMPVITSMVEGFTELVAWINRNEWVLYSLGGALAAVTLAMTWLAFTIAGITLPIWLPLLIVFGLVAAAITVIILIVQDLYVWLSGGESVLGPFIEAMLSLAGISLEDLRQEWRDLQETIAEAYNAVAGALGLPTISTGGGASDLDKREHTSKGVEGSGPERERNPVRRFFSNLEGFTAANNAGVTGTAPQNLLGRATGALGNRVTQQNEITINGAGGDPQEIADRVRRVLDRQNLDAVEALGQ